MPRALLLLAFLPFAFLPLAGCGWSVQARSAPSSQVSNMSSLPALTSLSGAPLPVTSADSRRALEMVTAFYYSSRTREEVVFPIGKEHPNYQSWLPEGFA